MRRTAIGYPSDAVHRMSVESEHIAFEIVPWKPEPIEESAPFKDEMKK